MKRHTSFYLVATILAMLAGCASIDFEYPRAESTVVVDTDDTYLASSAADLPASESGTESGFHPLENGIDALTARLLLADRAERTIDTQYYLMRLTPVSGQL